MKTFTTGPEIRELRSAIHLSQEEVALLFAVSMMTASKWERGVLHPDYSQRRTMRALWALSNDNPKFTQAKDIIRAARLQIETELRLLVVDQHVTMDGIPKTKPVRAAANAKTKPAGSQKRRRKTKRAPEPKPENIEAIKAWYDAAGEREHKENARRHRLYEKLRKAVAKSRSLTKPRRSQRGHS